MISRLACTAIVKIGLFERESVLRLERIAICDGVCRYLRRSALGSSRGGRYSVRIDDVSIRASEIILFSLIFASFAFSPPAYTAFLDNPPRRERKNV